MEGNPNKAMHVATLYLDIVGFSQGCPGYPEVPVCQYCVCVCVQGLWFMWDGQSVIQQHPALSLKDYCPVILRGMGAQHTCGGNSRGGADLWRVHSCGVLHFRGC